MHRRSDPQLCYVVNDVTSRLLISFLLFGLLFGILLSFVHFDKRSCRYVGEIFCKHESFISTNVIFFGTLQHIPSICHIVFAVPIAVVKSLLNV